ncbi:DASH complex subunit ASK1 [Aspergillus undulatus]|uniref:DASH complex subunit ASK1 n=1 Tax=Aspergillus undulatus TaxID=1810928 RepID=UPI003CCCE0F8
MSRPSSMVQRPLTLTEELEKLEQSITLTLQEIDHNFSRAHRIVATGILPVVQQYSEASRDVREGAKFWKKFFEESANVALSGYGEEPEQDTTVDETLPEDESASISQSHIAESEVSQTPATEHMHNRNPDDLDLTNLNISSHSTPRAAMDDNPLNDSTVTSSIAHPSPYDDLAEDDNTQHYQDDSYLPSTPNKQPSRGTYDHTYDDDPTSSPFIPPVSTEKLRSARNDNNDPVMHRFADRTYRVEATPLGKGKGSYDPYKSRFTVTPKTTSTAKYPFDDSPMTSPEPEAPQLNSELFSSPLKPQTPGTGRKSRPNTSRPRGAPKPGTSVLTPAKGGFGKRSEWDSDDDDDQFGDEGDDLGYSPPKTMQFHVPQSRLMKTPAKEASRRIVEQLLYTAGANDTTEDIGDDQSPSVIRRMERLEDDTF